MITIYIQSSATSVEVGEEFTVTIVFNSIEQVKSFGLKPTIDTNYFEIVRGEMLVSGAISDYRDGMGVVAYNTCTDVNAPVLRLVIKAKKAVVNGQIGCEASVIGADDNKMTGIQPAAITVTVK